MRLAISICEDAWNDKNFWPRRLYSFDPLEELMRQNPAIHINLSSSPFWHSKRKIRREMLAAIAHRDGIPVIMCNQVGGNDSLIFDGSSVALNAHGELIAQAKSFEEDLVIVDPFDARRRSPIRMRTTPRPPIAPLFSARATTCANADSAKSSSLSAEASTPPSSPPSPPMLSARRTCSASACPAPIPPQGSIDDSRALAANLGIRFELIGISGLFGEYTQALEPLFTGTQSGHRRRKHPVAHSRHIC